MYNSYAMRVQVRLLAGRTLLLDVEPTFYVAALKREICEREGAWRLNEQ